MKGLSPLIATVLLIAFTVGVAGILSVFFSSYTSEQTSAVDKRTSGTVECSGAFLRVERVNTSSSPSIVISNPTNNKVYVMSVIDNLGNINTTPATVQRAITTSVITVSINPNNVPHPSASKVTIRGFCETSTDVATNITIEGICEKGTSCWPN